MRNTLLKNIAEKLVLWINKLIPVLSTIDLKVKENEKKLKETRKAIEKLIKQIDKKLVSLKA